MPTLPQNYQQRVGAVLLNDTGDQVGYVGSPLKVGIDQTGPTHTRYDGHLTDDGLVDGDDQAIGDYSLVPTYFYFTATETVRIARMIVGIEDTTGMAANDYGNITGGLTNGVEVIHWDDDGVPGAATVLHTLTVNDPVTSNAEWGFLCYDVDLKTWGVGNEFLVVRWTFERAGGPLRMTAGQHFGVRLNDDFSGLIKHHFLIQGLEEGTFE